MIARLVGKQSRSVRLATARLNIWDGSVRSSKTISSLIAWLRYTRTGPDGFLLMAGRTERTLRRNVIDPLVDMLGQRRCRYSSGTGELWLLGRRVYVVGANDERSETKIRGLTLAGAYVDEASTIPESFWSMLVSRLSVDGARLYATTNPDAPTHWLKKTWLDRASVHLTGDGYLQHHGGEDTLDLARFSFRLADNPHLPAGYVAALAREFVGLWRRRYIDGDWVLAEGAVYEAWEPNRHVVDELPTISRWVGVGIDYGTVNPFAALLLGIGADRRLYVVAEWRYDSRTARRQLTDAEYSTRLRAWLASVPIPGTSRRGVRPEWTIVDPSAASFVTQLHRDGGLTPTLADNRVLDGIRTLASLLATDRLRVHSSCVGLIAEMPGYCWDDTKARLGQDAPVKVNDHSLDAARYVIHTTQSAWRADLAGAA